MIIPKNIVLACSLLLMSCFASCSVEDERDLCCENVEIHLRYSKGAENLIDQHINRITHYLFDGHGKLKEIITDPTTLSKKKIVFKGLEEGKYQLVSLANMTDKTLLSTLEIGKTTLSEFLLNIKGVKPNGMYISSDPLYWGVREFVAEKRKSHKYIMDLSNIHCKLTVTVRWENVVPPGTGNFELQLLNVPGKYSLNAKNGDYVYITPAPPGTPSSKSVILHTFPFVYEQAETLVHHYLPADYIAGRIKETFLTLRYTDHRIPTLRLFRGGQQIMKDIDLSRAFQAWGWEVSKNIEQNYQIEILIRKDGTVIVNPGTEAIVLDWVDGGEI